MVGDIIEFENIKYLVLAMIDYRDKPYLMVVDKSNKDLYKVLKCVNGIYKEEDNKHVINLGIVKLCILFNKDVTNGEINVIKIQLEPVTIPINVLSNPLLFR